ncbi:MAG: TonB-dependent receptor [Massilia sp.]
MRFKVRKLVHVLASANLLAWSFPVLAADVAEKVDATATAPATVVVTGFRKSYADALQMKRQAIGVSDSISAEGLETFPDMNVGEALQRIPGIQVNRDEESRNSSVNLRGLPGAYAKSTLNGMDFASPTQGGAPPLGAFDTSMFSAFTVTKSVSAAEQSGGISGNIDMQIAPALSRKEGTSIKFTEQYDELGNYKTPKLSGSFAKKFMNGDLGVFGVFAAKREHFRRDSIYSNQFTTLNPANTPDFLNRYKDYYAASCAGVPAPCVSAPGGTGVLSKGGVLIPSEIRQGVKYNDGTLVTGSLGVEYKVMPGWRVGATYLDSKREDHHSVQQLLINDTRPSTTIIDPTAAPFLHTDGRYYVMKYNFTNPLAYGSNRLEPFEQSVNGVALKSSFTNDTWRVDVGMTLSQATNLWYQSQTDVRNRSKPITTDAPFGNGVTGSLTMGSSAADYYQHFNQTTPVLTQANLGGTWSGTGAEVVSTTGDSLVITGSDNYQKNKVNSMRLDFERFIDAPLIESIQFGGQFNRNTSISRGFRSTSAGVDLTKITTASPFIQNGNFVGDFFGGKAPGYQSNWQTANIPALINTLQPTITGDYVRTASGWTNDANDGGYIGGNFTMRNEINAFYLMAKIDEKFLGIRVRGHVGVRHEETSQRTDSLDRAILATVNGTKQTTTTTFATSTHETQYRNDLPSLLLAADLTKKLVVRYGYYSTFLRPDARANLPVSTQVSQDALAGGYTVTLGRGGIKPYTSDSQDFSLEYYNRPNGLIGFAAYQKKIKGLIVGEGRDSVLCPADGYGLGLGNWSVVGDRCVTDLPATSATGTRALNGLYTIDVNGALNSPNELVVQGAELTIQQTFDFLPKPFNGLGGVVNVSFTRVRGSNVDGSPATLNNVSPRSANFILYYETPVWGVRGVYNHRDSYVLPGGNTFSGSARSVRARGQFDISASYKLSEKVKLAMNAFNLTNSFYEEYEGSEAKFRRASYDGRTVQATVQYNF